MTAARLLPVLCALAVVASGCGGMPGNVVAEVDGEPIKKAAFDHWMQIASKSGQGTEEQRRDQVMQFLVQHEWVKGEAADLGVKVSDAEVRRSYDQQKEQSFPQDADFRRFLRESGQTEEDLLLQVRVDLLTNGITEKVVEGERQSEQQRVLQEFGERFQRRWRERTTCRDQYATSLCENGPDPTPTPTPTPPSPTPTATPTPEASG
jgi:foldase protein PrsA